MFDNNPDQPPGWHDPNPDAPHPGVGHFTVKPNRPYSRAALIVGVVTAIITVAAAGYVVAAAGNDDQPATGIAAVTTPTTTERVTTTTERKATTTTIDRDAACKSALQQTADINAPFTACTGPQYDRLLATYGPGKPDRRFACEYANMGPACAGIPVTTTTTRPYDSLRSLWDRVDLDSLQSVMDDHSATLGAAADNPYAAIILWDETMAPSYGRIATAVSTTIGSLESAVASANLTPSDRAVIDRVTSTLRQVRDTHRAVANCPDPEGCLPKMRAANDALSVATDAMGELIGAM